MFEKEVEVILNGRHITIGPAKVAKQASGAAVVRMDETIVLVTATVSEALREGMDFFPLTCDYEERLYAVGKIPGSFPKREGKPSDRGIVTGRLVDRSIRPLFPSGMRNDVQVIAIPLSVDHNYPDVLAVVGASLALCLSKIPFAGPVGSVRIGRLDGQFIVNPNFEDLAKSDLDLVVSGTKAGIDMVEAGADQVPESVIIEAIRFAQPLIDQLVAAQEGLVSEFGVPKMEPVIYRVNADILQAVRDSSASEIRDALQQPDKAARESGITLLKEEIVAKLADQFPDQEADLGNAVEKVVKEELRSLILNEGRRPDGRGVDEIRKITCEVGLLPRVHGSGLFTRGQTQVLTVTTLGTLDQAQILDNLETEESKRYMHQYNFPPFSVGEARPMRGPGRREIGHGTLAERALVRMIPLEEEFPYTLRLVSEVLESNGSTSMASVCASTLSLMDAGVRIKAPVAGIAMGLMTDGDRYAVLTDIQGMEDFSGDMDFKVAGTRDGVTALQLDTKVLGISGEILGKAVEQARGARLYILDKILEAIPQAREEMSPYAPRIFVLEIHPDKIGDVIGPGGKIIKKITADTGARIDIEQNGKVYIAAVDAEAGERARKIIDDITRDVKIGETYLGKVVRIASFGAFIEVLPGKDGLLRVAGGARPEDMFKLGDEVMVKVEEIDSQGRVNLSSPSFPSAAPGGDGGRRGGPDRGGRPGGGFGPGGGGRSREREPEGRFRPKRT
ncbi:MAG: polyribonucleotide nucleotidyltransferase [Armatimonadetes bacterium]|nr:polyribonucleotide nucleotidyltransferase [Armatimonadota bacterium]